jgi:TPR repeat protein
MALLGSMYFLGEGVPVDGKKAVALLSKAAGMGDGVAAHNLGVLFQRGTPDVPPDRNQSMHFYRLARDLGAQFWPDEFYQ